MDTALAPSGVPTLHVYILEAHGQDELPVNVGPLNLAREYNQPKTITERRAAAKDALELIKGWTNGPVTMFLDDMNNALENAYEARPWRYYVIDTETKKIVDGTAPPPPYHLCGVLRLHVAGSVSGLRINLGLRVKVNILILFLTFLGGGVDVFFASTGTGFMPFNVPAKIERMKKAVKAQK